MNEDRPRPTPEGQLIRRVRDLTIPKLSIRVAAARIGMSAEQWGYIERGYFPSRGGNPPQPFSPPAVTLAKMAHALRINPERLESEGQRPDAAEILREIVRDDAPAPVSPTAKPPPPVRRDAEFTSGGGDAAALEPYIEDVRRQVYDALVSYYGDEAPPPDDPRAELAMSALPGAAVFPGDDLFARNDANTWDKRALNLREKVVVIAVGRRLRAQADERKQRRTGLRLRASPPTTRGADGNSAHLVRHPSSLHSSLHSSCYNFPYGFKGAPSARQA